MWRWLRRAVLLYAVIPYGSVVLIFTVFQRQLMYRPVVAYDLRIRNADLRATSGEDLKLTTTDGITICGWLLRCHRDDDASHHLPRLVLYFPGNAGNRSDRLPDLREFTASGFDVLIFDYRGFGDSAGAPSEASLIDDAHLIWHYACHDLGYAEQRIVIFGESLGGAVALSLWDGAETWASEQSPKPAALILNSTFASMPQTVAWHYPWFPFRYLLFDHWSSINRIPSVTVPVVVFHGTDDEFIPLQQGRELAAAGQAAQMIEIPGGTHNSIPMAQLRTELESIASRLDE
ncbi:MAG: alpha/beta hydrolase [Planctomycetaceae bacterium]|nr:alpha/beta hydrolase [Planctomycetaceae bacterium]